ncbi:MAG TPA: hypothetical protein VHC19_14210, partial [Pirellulales bacterium]|nr:hypothetical protein [Pirellulales bacterium]
ALRAVEQALQTAQPGELLVVQADVIEETVEFVKRYVQQRVPGREIDLLEATNEARLASNQSAERGHRQTVGVVG